MLSAINVLLCFKIFGCVTLLTSFFYPDWSRTTFYVHEFLNPPELRVDAAAQRSSSAVITISDSEEYPGNLETMRGISDSHQVSDAFLEGPAFIDPEETLPGETSQPVDSFWAETEDQLARGKNAFMETMVTIRPLLATATKEIKKNPLRIVPGLILREGILFAVESTSESDPVYNPSSWRLSYKNPSTTTAMPDLFEAPPSSIAKSMDRANEDGQPDEFVEMVSNPEIQRLSMFVTRWTMFVSILFSLGSLLLDFCCYRMKKQRHNRLVVSSEVLGAISQVTTLIVFSVLAAVEKEHLKAVLDGRPITSESDFGISWYLFALASTPCAVCVALCSVCLLRSSGGAPYDNDDKRQKFDTGNALHYQDSYAQMQRLQSQDHLYNPHEMQVGDYPVNHYQHTLRPHQPAWYQPQPPAEYLPPYHHPRDMAPPAPDAIEHTMYTRPNSHEAKSIGDAKSLHENKSMYDDKSLYGHIEQAKPMDRARSLRKLRAETQLYMNTTERGQNRHSYAGLPRHER